MTTDKKYTLLNKVYSNTNAKFAQKLQVMLPALNLKTKIRKRKSQSAKPKARMCPVCKRYIRQYGLVGCSCLDIRNDVKNHFEQITRSQTYEKRRLGTIKATHEQYTYFIHKGNNSYLIDQAMQKRANWTRADDDSQPTNFTWKPTSHGLRFERLHPNSTFQKVYNHLEYHRWLSEKDNLANNMRKICAKMDYDIAQMIPWTFKMNLESSQFSQQASTFMYVYKMLQSGELQKPDVPKIIPEAHYTGSNIWLLKPVQMNRGRGIHLFQTLKQFKALIKQYKRDMKKNPLKKKPCRFIIQKYVERPLLIHNRKFDIRIWVLVTQSIKFYIYKDGYIRTSCNDFSLENIGDNLTHLTNNAIQKHADDYGKFEDGNQLSFEDFQSYLSTHHTGVVFKTDIMPKITKQIMISLMAVRKKLNANQRKHWFEIFGYDFIIDGDLDPWMIEVNTNPCLELSSPLLERYIPTMLDEALMLTVDQIFVRKHEPKTRWKRLRNN